MSTGREFAFQFTLNAIARVLAESEDDARDKLNAINEIYLDEVYVPGLDGRLTEASLAHEPDEAELFEIDGEEPCRECGEPYPDGGDGWDGLCPDCADRASAIEDAEDEGWAFVEAPSGWYAEREYSRTPVFAEKAEVAYFIDDAADLLDLPDPGKPDIVYLGRRRAIFVHGCFWHGHDCARGARMPRANVEYWSAKIARNRARDAAVRERLAAAGWESLVVWECELRDDAALSERLAAFLQD
jgi:DNA mismatch endonuclease Vsr